MRLQYVAAAVLAAGSGSVLIVSARAAAATYCRRIEISS